MLDNKKKACRQNQGGQRTEILWPSLFSDVTQRRLVFTDVSGQPVGPIIKGQAIREVATDKLSRNVCNYQNTLRNIPE
jgi:hypothetical protein